MNQRFALVTANSVIPEALPEDADIVHTFDFQGVQWPPMIEDLARRRTRMVRLIAINSPVCMNMGQIFGLRLKVKEMDKEALDEAPQQEHVHCSQRAQTPTPVFVSRSRPPPPRTLYEWDAFGTLLLATVACGRKNAVAASTRVQKPRVWDLFGPQNMERT
ncbi:hypothetical protein OIU85_001530 [Salix viminalis]|uniref:Uncharacterized protein n=1 Tax=Salix viminalis TaxID=40686 RepID=A0A9Q0ZXV9_SALVM|nr:hypothetical protein OIU85_001530 [Salix viminalis]